MIKHEVLLKYLEDLIRTKIKHDDQLSNLKIDFQDEFNYNSEVEALFVLKVLSGQISIGTLTLPIQLMAEVDNDYVREVVDLLSQIAYENNENAISLGDGYFAKVFFRTPSVITTFQNKGLKDFTGVAMDISFLITQEAITFNNMYLRLYNPNTEEMEDVINMLDCTYLNKHIKDARTLGNDINQQSFTNAIQKEITVDYIVSANNPIHQMIIDECDMDNEYTVEYYNGVYEKKYTMSILSYDEVHILGDILKAKLTLVQGKSD